MSDFSFLKNYVLSEGDVSAHQMKHSFYALDNYDVESAQERIGFKFPNELKEFYTQIGYGFICNTTKKGVNRLMDPSSIADFRLGEGIYEYDPDREVYNNNKLLVFFEVAEGTYLTMDLVNETENGESPIYYFDEKIADSLYEFLIRMDLQTDYYL